MSMETIWLLRPVMVLFAVLELIRIGLLSWPAVEDRLVRFGIQKLGSTRFDAIAVTGSLWRVYTCVVAAHVTSPAWMEVAVVLVAVVWALKYLVGNVLLWLAWQPRVPYRWLRAALAVFGTFVSRQPDKPYSRMLRAVSIVAPSFLYLLYV
jgi:hypothetical protein